MYRILIDTNVYISGIFWTGLPDRLLKMADRKKFITLISQNLIEEIKDILTRKNKPFRLKIDEAEKVVHHISEYAVKVVPSQKVTICRDFKDNMVLECATTGKANFIVTGDLDLLELNNYKGIEIVTVNRMLEILSL